MRVFGWHSILRSLRYERETQVNQSMFSPNADCCLSLPRRIIHPVAMHPNHLSSPQMPFNCFAADERVHYTSYFPMAYCAVYFFASFSYNGRLFLNNSAEDVSSASSGTGSVNKFWVAINTFIIRELGFHVSPFRMPMHMLPCSSKVTLGCQIRVLKFMVGGLKGYSTGSVRSSLNLPP